jgi:charged multivesicular body protein 2A
MAVFFGGARPSQQNTLKQYTRELNRHVRSMEREVHSTTLKEKQVISEIKKYATKNDVNMAKLKAKELIRSRAYSKRLLTMQQGLMSLSQQLSVIQSSQKGHEILAKATHIIHALNNKLDISSAYRMLSEFERQNTVMQEKQEIIQESLENIFELDESDIDSTVSQVFEEIGLPFSQLGHATPLQSNDSTNIEERFNKLLMSCRPGQP